MSFFEKIDLIRTEKQDKIPTGHKQNPINQTQKTRTIVYYFPMIFQVHNKS